MASLRYQETAVGRPVRWSDLSAMLGGSVMNKVYELNNSSLKFDSRGRCIIFFATQSLTSGHWTCAWKSPGVVHYFDPYGIRPDGGITYFPQKLMSDLGQALPVLDKALHDAAGGGEVWYNSERFQTMSNRVETCAYHCVLRLLHKDMPGPEYTAWLTSQPDGPDAAAYRLVTGND